MEEWKNGRMEEWKNGRMEGWKDGRMEGWKNGRVEEWKDGGMEGWKGWRDGRMEGMEGWKDGRMEEWKDGRVEGWKGGRMEGWRLRSLEHRIWKASGPSAPCRAMRALWLRPGSIWGLHRVPRLPGSAGLHVNSGDRSLDQRMSDWIQEHVFCALSSILPTILPTFQPSILPFFLKFVSDPLEIWIAFRHVPE